MTDSPGTFEQFLLWERASRDTLEVKRLYIDMARDLVAGVVLSQIVYWHLPNRDGQARLQVQREGKRWLAKGRADWWDECRISPKQADRALQILEARGLIEVRLFQFGKAPTKHVRILPEGFLAAWRTELARSSEATDEEEYLPSDFPQRVKSISTKGRNPSSPKVEIHLPQRGKSLDTETTTEITAAAQEPARPDSPHSAAAALVEELVSHGVGRAAAKRFAREKPETCRRQLQYLPYARFKSKGAWLANAIRDDYGPPRGYEEATARKAREQDAEGRRLARKALQQHGLAIREEKTTRLRAAYRQLEEKGGEALRAFGEYVEQERARTGRVARHLSPARRAEVLAAFDQPEQRLELFKAWMNSGSAFPVQKLVSPTADGPSPAQPAVATGRKERRLVCGTSLPESRRPENPPS